MSGSRLWWKHGIIYQIYPRSFFDSNGDGIGDIPGITSKLDYLSFLGVDAVWLSPVNKSPMFDFGYDVSDYREIDPVFGNKSDYLTFIKEAHKRNIKVIMDLVFNHTSHLHPWFVESRSSRNNSKSDWYIWKDGVKGKYPNNWMAEFGGRSWEWDDTRGQYYLHLFLREQPDLNWRNPEVRKAVYDEFRYWLDAGVDGFRLDVINFFIKDDEFRSNPFGLGPYAPRPHDLQKHIYDRNQPEMHEILREMRAVTDSYEGRMMVGETFSDDRKPALAASYIGNGNDQLHLAFDFSTMFLKWDSKKFFNSIDSWINAVPAEGWPCHVFSNHDQPRSMTRFRTGKDSLKRARALAVLLMTLKGTPFIYYGEEIGMANRRIPKKYIQDPVGLRYWPLPVSRDGERTPMQWTSGKHAGFTGNSPWLPVHENYKEVNVEAQTKDENSLLNIYRTLIQIRKKSDSLTLGSWEPLVRGEGGIIAYKRAFSGEETSVIINFRGSPVKADSALFDNKEILFSTHRKSGGRLTENSLHPYEALILK